MTNISTTIIDGEDLSDLAYMIDNISFKDDKSELSKSRVFGFEPNSSEISIMVGQPSWWYRQKKCAEPDTFEFIRNRYKGTLIDALQKYDSETVTRVSYISSLIALIDMELKVEISSVLFKKDLIFSYIKRNCTRSEPIWLAKRYFEAIPKYCNILVEYAKKNNINLDDFYALYPKYNLFIEKYIKEFK